ncbi:MAG: tetratricopeptide repeat protein [Leptolyngbyaceae cyanobacterium bins.302]|nr:tetratricopeptide repeat protein [Leptolyngbyaceae cyanobacterium bins.302]
MAKLQRQDYQGAGSDFNEALRLNPNYAEAYYGRGRVRYFLYDDRGAILDFNEAIRLKPNYAEAYYGRALAHMYVEAYEASSNDFLTALRLQPDYAEQPDLWSDFGQLLLAVGENEEALAHFNEALRLQSNHADAHYGRALARYKLNGDLRAFISELEGTARLYREQGDTQSFSETVAEINRARDHLNQQNVGNRQDDSVVCNTWDDYANAGSRRCR